MIGERIKKLRLEKDLSLRKLGELVDRSASSLSRLENNQTTTWEPELAKNLADKLGTTTSYLMGITDDPNYPYDDVVQEYTANDSLQNIIIDDDEMDPELPNGSIVKIRPVDPKEKIQIGSFYYIEFNEKKCFRLAIEDHIDGLGFLPNDLSERRISYDLDYVKIIGKAVSMHVIFEDTIEYK